MKVMNIKTKLVLGIGMLAGMIILLVTLSVVNLQILTATEPDSPAAMPGLERALLWISITGGICIFTGLGLLYWLPRSISKPVKELKDGILEIANHNYEKRLDMSDNEEFREVADSFNRMAERLTEYRASTLSDILSAKKFIEAIVNSIDDPIIGLNTENVEINEGLIRFDIIFYVRLPSEDSKDAGLTQIIINVEAQKDEPTSYEILNRAIFYASRLVSSQKERDFVKSGYDDIKRVYSIWICMNMEQNSMNHIHFVNDAVIGNHEWKGKIDLINIIMIGIAKELPEQDERYELHRLLGALLSQKLTVDEKMSIMETEYDIELEENLRRDVSTMCNLSEGIEEKGIAIGEARAEATMIARMHKNGMQPEQIAAVTEKSIEEVRKIIADCENG